MSEWKDDQLGSVLEIKYGKDHKALEDGDIPCIGSGGIMRYVNDSLYDKVSILIPRKGSLNNIMYQDKPFWTVDTMFWSIINEEKVNPKFLFYQLTLIDYTNLNVGSAVPSLTVPVINEIDITLPEKDEQNAIASVLSSLDDKIDLLHHQNQTLEQMAETLFRQWFVEEADEGWEESTIKDFDVLVTDYVANGSFASLKENVTLITDREEYALFIRNTDLKSGFANKVYVDEHAYNFLSKSKLFGGEVIISSVGDVGSVFRCPKFDIPMTLGNNIIMLKSEYNLFFYLLFQSKYGQDMIYGITSGSVQQKFNKTAFRGLKINYPSIEYIAEFESFVQPYFDKIDFNQTQIRTLTALRDTLLPKLMSGEIRLNYDSDDFGDSHDYRNQKKTN